MARKHRRMKRAFTRMKAHYTRHKQTYGIMGTFVGAALYGAFRNRLAIWVEPVSSKVPLGNISDEITLGVGMILGKRFLGRKMPILNNVFNAGIAIESARIGEQIASGNVYGQSASSGYMLG